MNSWQSKSPSKSKRVQISSMDSKDQNIFNNNGLPLNSNRGPNDQESTIQGSVSQAQIQSRLTPKQDSINQRTRGNLGFLQRPRFQKQSTQVADKSTHGKVELSVRTKNSWQVRKSLRSNLNPKTDNGIDQESCIQRTVSPHLVTVQNEHHPDVNSILGRVSYKHHVGISTTPHAVEQFPHKKAGMSEETDSKLSNFVGADFWKIDTGTNGSRRISEASSEYFKNS